MQIYVFAVLTVLVHSGAIKRGKREGEKKPVPTSVELSFLFVLCKSFHVEKDAAPVCGSGEAREK